MYKYLYKDEGQEEQEIKCLEGGRAGSGDATQIHIQFPSESKREVFLLPAR